MSAEERARNDSLSRALRQCIDRRNAAFNAIDDLRKRVDELLAKCTDVENERRAWKARAEARRAAMMDIVDRARGPSPDDALARAHADLSRRHDELLADAWAHQGAAARGMRDLARSFCEGAALAAEGREEGFADDPKAWVAAWAERFRALLP